MTNETNTELKMRDYRVTKSNHKHGEKHMFEGKEYVRLYIGGAIFDKETDTTKAVAEFKADTKLWKNNKKAYFKKYQV
tara:strand:+ start:3694 stop:3927 length:234 start_codon:yes stop_codon:yes gene_type:complete